ncbi:hypothetical protein K523DRAFT_321777 [Schizophyllum commune Tattone D]|nr:hypothetical protein K523DRAFT_321777 [Schizophyllum commune Tattone D]
MDIFAFLRAATQGFSCLSFTTILAYSSATSSFIAGLPDRQDDNFTASHATSSA